MLAALTVCPAATAPPKIEVIFGAEMTKYTEQYYSHQLNPLLAQDKDSTLTTDSRSTVFGVTSSRISEQTQIQFSTLTDGAGRQCLYIDKAVFRIAYAPTVYVSADILNMACSYAVTRAHEQTHVAIDYKALQDYLPFIRRDMANYLNAYAARGFGPYPVSSLNKYKDAIMTQVGVAASPMIERMRETRRKNQGAIDTPENYRHEAEKCPQDKQAIWRKFGGGRE
jgi:hypothetical protein